MADASTATKETPSPATAGRRCYLRVDRLTKKFGDFTALKDITLDVHEREFLCFLGPSGCGKTTLLRCIAGLEVQTHGRIEQAERDISVLPPTERDFGIVFQSYALFPNLTVFKNIGYGLQSQKVEKTAIKTRVNELLELVGLTGHEAKYPAQLSGGEQQRVALARALAMSPGLLLLDEPLSALDAKVRVRLRHEIKQLQRKLGVTTIMVTHDQEEALTMGDRIVVMNQGVIEQVGTPLEIYSHPATTFVADFVGTMNFLSDVVISPRRVRLGRVELDCAHGLDGLAQGAAVTVSFRPENLALGEAGADTTNALEARIENIEFLGSFCRTSLVVDGTDDICLTVDISANVFRDLSIREGMDITVVVPADHIHVFANG